MKLTKSQIEELRDLAKEPRPTFGKARARVQRNLFSMGYVIFTTEDGTPDAWVEGAVQCRITDEGRAALADAKR
jgi:hypothetical protein